LLLGSVSLALVAPSLIYTILMFRDPDPELAREALYVLVNFRNPQHALVSAWLNWTVWVQGLILLVGLFLVRRTKLFQILLVVTLGMAILTSLQIVSANQWLAMIFPWRVSILLVPMGTTTIIAVCATKFMDWIDGRPTSIRWVNLLSLLVIAGLVIIGAIRFQVESQRKSTDPALPMMKYVAAHKTSRDLYMVPSKMEDFRLVTGAPILVDFRSAPDQDADVMEWYQRLQWISWFYNNSDNPCKLLTDIASQYGVTHVVLQQNTGIHVCNSMPILYEDEQYLIYSISPQE
jgi:hypothetical protein